MTRLVIVCDHPSLHLGFSTVGKQLARRLHASGRWQVEFIGRHRPAADRSPEPYPVFDVDSEGEGERDGRLAELLSGRLGSRPPVSDRTLLLSLGSPADQKDLLDQLDRTDLRRHLRLVSYMPVDFTPLPLEASELFRRIDLLVPYTHYGSRVLHEVCAPFSERPEISAPIPHGVDLDTFHPPDPGERRRLRAQAYGAGDDDILIGFFGRNSGHKHADLALRIFAAFAFGSWVACGHCRRVSPHPIDCLGASARAPIACPVCGSERLVPGATSERGELVLHTELLGRRERRQTGGWDLAAIARRLGIQNRVHLDPSLRIGEGVPETELALRMGACDIHLMPYDAGGWELTVLETGACGVANLITDTAAPPEYARPFSETVPPSVRLGSPRGDREIIDLGRAVEALGRLVDDPSLRAELGRRGVEVAALHSWETIARSWDRLLFSFSEGST